MDPKFLKSAQEIFADPAEFELIDVRKPAARNASGLTVPGARYLHPFDALNWWEKCRDRRVAVFCVHGEEVSQAVCGFLRDNGVEAYCVRGGFEAWREAGLPTITLSEGAK